MMKNENLLVVVVIGVVSLLMVGGLAGLIVSGQRTQVARQAEQERIVADF